MKAADALKAGDTSLSIRAAKLSLRWAAYSQDNNRSKAIALRVKANSLLARISFERNQFECAAEYITLALTDTVSLEVQPIDIALLSAIGANCMHRLNREDESIKLLKMSQGYLVRCSKLLQSSAFSEEDSEKLSYAMQRVNITMKEMEEKEREIGPIKMILFGGILLSIIGVVLVTFFHFKIKILKNSG